MSTTAASPGLEAHRIESEITHADHAEDIHLGQPVCGIKACKKEGECVCDPESLKTSVTTQSSQPAQSAIPEVDMTPAQIRKHKLEGLRVILGGGLMHLVINFLSSVSNLYRSSVLFIYGEQFPFTLLLITEAKTPLLIST